MDNKHTGDFICARRKELNLSQKDLAEKLNVTDKAVSKWETGRSAPNISILEPLAEVLGVTVAELLKGEKAKNESLNNTSNEIIVEIIKKSKKSFLICTPKVRHFWRCIFLWQKKERYNKSIVQNSK